VQGTLRARFSCTSFVFVQQGTPTDKAIASLKNGRIANRYWGKISNGQSNNFTIRHREQSFAAQEMAVTAQQRSDGRRLNCRSDILVLQPTLGHLSTSLSAANITHL